MNVAFKIINLCLKLMNVAFKMSTVAVSSLGQSAEGACGWFDY